MDELARLASIDKKSLAACPIVVSWYPSVGISLFTCYRVNDAMTGRRLWTFFLDGFGDTRFLRLWDLRLWHGRLNCGTRRCIGMRRRLHRTATHQPQ
jgi:hypothetical protein